MKILWVSNSPKMKTGYGTQTAQVTKRLKEEGHEVAILANSGHTGYVDSYEGMPVFGNGYTTWSNDVVGELATRALGVDLVIVLFDAWPLDVEVYGKLNAAVWTPIDHLTVPPKVKAFFDQSKASPIAMSKHGLAAMTAAGFADVPYVPHGIETSVFQPYDKAEMRKEHLFPEERFMVGMVSTNKGNQPSRKAFEVAFRAFGAFCKAIPEAMMYVHSEFHGRLGGIDLRILATHYEIPQENLFFADELVIPYPIQDATMAQIYSSFDVLSFATMGEGFGIPAIEAQACGCPVITSNFTAQAELNPIGWQVGGQLWWDDYQKADMQIPSDREMLTALAAAYEARNDQSLRDKCRDWAQQYDADLVFEKYWVPTLAKLEADLPSTDPIVV